MEALKNRIINEIIQDNKSQEQDTDNRKMKIDNLRQDAEGNNNIHFRDSSEPKYILFS